MMTYVSVILPLKLSWCPVYKAPDGISAGDRVRVQFAGKQRTGVVSAVGVDPGLDESRILEISGIETGLMPFSAQEIRFWEFLSDYYMCSPGEVFKAACPEQKLRSERTAARVADRAAQARLRTLSAAVDTEQRRMDRISARIEARKAAIPGRKPGTKARAAMEADIARLESELVTLKSDLEIRRAALEAFLAAPGAWVAGRTVAAPVPDPGKPQVLISGHRTETCLKLASEVVSAGGQVLVLTPEKAFCSAVAAAADIPVTVFSSDLSAPSRRRISDTVRSGSPVVVIGTRSALWLPWNGLRLVVIDEEQDTFHKQTEPAPRLHARDAAVALAGIHGARVILGTSCPSLETRLNVIAGKYSVYPIPEAEVRAGEDSGTLVIDIPSERRKNGMLGPVSRMLAREIGMCTGRVVLVRGWEKPDELQELLGGIFPEGGRDISVMTLSELKREGCAGAQLLAVLQADALVSRSDFRADERALQLLAQFRAMCPRVVIQTAVPERFATCRSDSDLLKERKAFGFPPYRRMIDIIVSDSDADRLGKMAPALSGVLSAAVLSPEDALMTSTIQDGSVLLRVLLHRDAGTAARKSAIRSAIDSFEHDRRYSGHIIIDVDPQ